MPQPKRSTARSGAARKPAAKRSTASRKTTGAKRPTTAKRSTAAKRPTTAKRTTARKATGTRKAAGGPRTSAAEARAEERIRELNERAIKAGKELGTAALDAYESVLKTIAKTLESGPGRSDVDWVAQAGKAQADIVKEALKLVPRARKALK
ncbi:MAG: hypothetical protein U0T02_12075 [Solirubrobacteraceae bacterium]